MSFTDRIQHAWNAFLNRNERIREYYDYGISYGIRPDRPIFHRWGAPHGAGRV